MRFTTFRIEGYKAIYNTTLFIESTNFAMCMVFQQVGMPIVGTSMTLVLVLPGSTLVPSDPTSAQY